MEIYIILIWIMIYYFGLVFINKTVHESQGFSMLDKDKGKEICFAVDKVEKLSAAERKDLSMR